MALAAMEVEATERPKACRTASKYYCLAPATGAPVSAIVTARGGGIGATPTAFSRLCVISRSERRFIEDGIRQGIRSDGRRLLDNRPRLVETGVIPSCNGSARVRTADVELEVGVKVDLIVSELGEVLSTIDCAANRLDSSTDWRYDQQAATYLSQLIDRLCLTSVPRELLRVTDTYAWRVYVDIIILNGGGNILDAASLGVYAALSSTILPKITQIGDQVEEEDAARGTVTVDFDVDPRPEVGMPFPCDRLPICITVGQIQGLFVWDLSLQEEACAAARWVVAVDKEGRCQALHKTGDITIALKSLSSAMQNSQLVGKRLLKELASLCGPDASRLAAAAGASQKALLKL